MIGYARLRYPGDLGLDTEWAQLAMAESDWPEAILRLSTILRDHRTAPPEVHARLAIAHRENGQPDVAATIIQQGWSSYPRNLRLDTEWAQLATADQDWPGAVERLTQLLNRHTAAPGKVYVALAHAHRETGKPEMAATVIAQGISKWPDDQGLLNEHAQLAMVDRDWPEAMRRWQRFLANAGDARPWRPPNLPLRDSAARWQESEWLGLVEHWLVNVRTPQSAVLCRAVAHTLMAIDASREATAILEFGLRHHPDDAGLRFDTVRNAVLLAKPAQGQPSDSDLLLRALMRAQQLINEGGGPALGGLQSPWGTWQTVAPTAPNDAATGVATLASFATAVTTDGLPELRRIRIPLGSTLELEVRAGRHFTERTVESYIRFISEQDHWPEIEHGTRPLEARARQLADEYGRRFEELPYLPVELLADAVFRLLYSELCVHEPVRRLADRIAAESDADPVFIEISGREIAYLSTFTWTEFGQIRLYVELRQRGTNAFLCEFVDPAVAEDGLAGENQPLAFRPSHVLLRPQETTQDPDQTDAEVAVVPGAIRSVERVVKALSNPLVYATGYVIEEYAYDRSSSSALDFAASFLPRRTLLPRVPIHFWSAARLDGEDLLARQPTPARAAIELSAPLQGDWLAWMSRILQPSLAELARRSYAEVESRGVKEAHVSDNLFPESAVFAGAVKALGGRVVLWPHSANPVDVGVRAPGSFDVVHAVTKTGAAKWRERFPSVEVIHSASLMLPRPTRQHFDETAPLSVVVLGGKNVLGQMPFLNQSLHEASYRAFFSGLEALQTSGGLRVFFKPKGPRAENEAWLRRVVGRAASWEPVLEHPLRIQLPNMLFVTVSVGSSALLEGLGRGIPGLIVRDFPVNDYTTLSPGALPIGPTDEMLEVVRACAMPAGLSALAEQEMHYYVEETGYREMDISDST